MNDVIEVLISYGVNQVQLRNPFPTSSGTISFVGLNSFSYSNGTEASYDELSYDELEDLAYVVEQEILYVDNDLDIPGIYSDEL